MPSLANSISRLGTESAFAVLARAKQLEREGADIVHLEIGEPDFDTPVHVVEAAVAALRAGETRYCPTEGLPELREAAAGYLGAGRGVTIEPSRVLIATGAKPFLFFTILACIDPGDEVIYPDPGFPIYRSAISWAGGVPVALPLHEERGFSFDPNELEALISARTKLVILNSPQNPTGGVILEPDLHALAELLEPTDPWILSDEVYSKFVYGSGFASIASLPGLLARTIIVDGCSKTFAMTGWRCGFAAMPEPLVDPLTRFLVNSTSCVPPFVQRAAVAALTGSMAPVQNMLNEFEQRRELVVAGLNALPGVTCRPPAGAFYAFANVAGTGFTGDELAGRLLEHGGVAVLSGSAFGERGAHHIRLSYAASRGELAEGVRRIGRELARPANRARQSRT